MTRTGWSWVVAVAAVAAGCTGSRYSRQASRQPSQPAPAPAESRAPSAGRAMVMPCPMSVPGTDVAAEETPDGEALTFTTTSPQLVPDLRERVHAMADMHNRHHHGGQMGTQGMHGDAHAGMRGEARQGATEGEPHAGVNGEAGGGMQGEAQGGTTHGGAGAARGGTGSGEMGAGSAGSSEGSHEGTDAHARMPPPSRAVVEDVDGGARLTLTPDDPADLDRLRTAIRAHAEHMQHTYSCSMGEAASGPSSQR
ncbi:MAG TPA: hypothetical protein VFL83_07130 [Anaeromyxobacter sp.]|nr:hypothetical protein [Anaeromyxobacter sp.]